jgi:acyl-CoA synthetase (AMP-forming)/AMP-acid ligase II
VPRLELFVEIGGSQKRPWAERYDTLRDSASAEEPEMNAGGDDLLTIVYTSGTTGLPKGVVHSHRTAMTGIINGISTLEFSQAERYLVVLPLFHVGASTPMLIHLYRGSTVFLMRQFDPAAMWEVFETERITSALAVPTMLNFMLQVPHFESRDRSHLRGIMTGASPVPVELINAYMKLGIDIRQVYGLTETFGPGCYLPGAEAAERLGSTGKGYMLTEVRIVDADGIDVPPGTPGQILLKGDHNMVGYWNNPDATAETLIDGWLHTGDIGITDEDGYVTVQDRVKDMIISGGENVYPAEIENVLLSHPDVLDAAVIGQPSALWGESPFAVLVPANDNVESDAILAHCQDRLAGFKIPKGFAFIDEIPRNPSGKPLKHVLREQFPGPAPE